MIDNSAVATSATGTETIFLGSDCKTAHGIFGIGKWCWANGGFLAEFADYDFGFGRQELHCDLGPEPQGANDCGC